MRLVSFKLNTLHLKFHFSYIVYVQYQHNLVYLQMSILFFDPSYFFTNTASMLSSWLIVLYCTLILNSIVLTYLGKVHLQCLTLFSITYSLKLGLAVFADKYKCKRLPTSNIFNDLIIHLNRENGRKTYYSNTI